MTSIIGVNGNSAGFVRGNLYFIAPNSSPKRREKQAIILHAPEYLLNRSMEQKGSECKNLIGYGSSRRGLVVT